MESKTDSTLVVYTKRVNVCGTRSAGRRKFNRNVNGIRLQQNSKITRSKKEKRIMVLRSIA